MAIRHYGPTEIETAAESMEELDFLCPILENHQDETTKLVYADWLEERGDERGPFLRDFVRRASDPHAALPSGDEFPLVWRNVVGVRPQGLIRELILGGSILGSHVREVESEMMRRVRPTLYAAFSPADDADLPPGCTKFGGRPDLPAGVEWPVYPWPDAAAPLEIGVGVFCAQIRLSDLRACVAARELPPEGLLAFFYPMPLEGPSVFLYPESGPFHRPDPPPRSRMKNCQADSFYPLPAGRLRLVEGVDLYDSIEGEDCRLPMEFWRENWDAFTQLFVDLGPPEMHRDIFAHQLLGNGPGRSTGTAPVGERRLASFGSVSREHDWGDTNNPTWNISENDLAAGRFHNAWVHGG